MARHPQPREVAELKGAHKKDPQRYRNDPPKDARPAGNPPAHLSEGAKAAWFELADKVPPGVLTWSDTMILEVASNLTAEYRRDPDGFPMGKYTHMIGCYARLGMSPSDRRGLGVEKPKANSFADLDA